MLIFSNSFISADFLLGWTSSSLLTQHYSHLFQLLNSAIYFLHTLLYKLCKAYLELISRICFVMHLALLFISCFINTNGGRLRLRTLMLHCHFSSGRWASFVSSPLDHCFFPACQHWCFSTWMLKSVAKTVTWVSYVQLAVTIWWWLSVV